MLEIRNPATTALIDTLKSHDADGVKACYAKARAAQPAWAAQPIAERVAVIRRFAEALQANGELLAQTLTVEMGKPITQARGEVRASDARIQFFLEHVDALEPETVHSEPGLVERIDHEPLGVIANISAWNYPYFVGLNVIVPALLAGNAVLYKPSEHATLTGLAIEGLLHDAGVPADVFQTLVGAGSVGAQLLMQPVDGVFFTGSYETGRKIAQVVSARLTKVQLELGGKDPAYVPDDADPRDAAVALAEGAFYNAGQSCCAVERIYVHTAVYDAFVERFVEAVADFRMGDPTEESTFIGPLARRAQLSVLAEQVDDAVAKGATAVLGGTAREDWPGAWFEPTVLIDVDHTMRVMTEESFGPIIGIQRVADDADAIAKMQDTPYGLTAAVYTPSQARAEAILRQVPSGSSYWNCCDRVSPRLPWSGRGHSGLGLTLSVAGLRAFTQPRAWHLRG